MYGYFLNWTSLSLLPASVDYAECGVRSDVPSAECGKYGVWKMRSVENEECGNSGV